MQTIQTSSYHLLLFIYKIHISITHILHTRILPNFNLHKLKVVRTIKQSWPQHLNNGKINSIQRNITLVKVFKPAFEAAYARPPGRWPLVRPPIEEILMMEPARLVSRMCMHIYFDTNQHPLRFVPIT